MRVVMPERERRLVFLAKCALCILLVCVALDWRPLGAPPSPGREAAVVARRAPPPADKGFAHQAAEAANSLMRAAMDALAGAARDKCLAAPQDCISAAQRLQAAAPRAR